jgi:transposase
LLTPIEQQGGGSLSTTIRLSEARRKQFVRRGRKSGDPVTAVRFQIIAKLGRGRSHREIAEALDVVPATVSRVRARYLRFGVLGLYDLRRRNGSTLADDRFRRQLLSVLRRSPQDFGWERPTWTRELLCLEMKRQGFARVSPPTMGRALRAIGARLGSPKPIVCCPWPRRRREQALASIAWLASHSTSAEPVYFSDEVDIHLNPKIGRDWMLPGMQRLVITPGKNKKHYLAGALHAATGNVVWVSDESKSSKLFCTLLWKLAALHPGAKRIHLIVDNYKIHDSLLTRRVLDDLNGRIVLHFLPPYCPDSNRIERLWRDLHANVTRNHRCPSIEELMARVYTFLRAHNARHHCKPSLKRITRLAA